MTPKLLAENAVAVPKTLGGGTFGHVGTVVKKSVYATLTTTAYKVPVEPSPAKITAKTTEEQEHMKRDKYKEEMRIY
eukprot:472945-Ditylum_brightwellii.AAC.1